MSLGTVLTELALAGEISWRTAAAVLDAAGSERESRDELEAVLARRSQPSEPLRAPADERDVAFVIWLRTGILGEPENDYTRDWRAALAETWDGASAEEAFCFELRIVGNRGDGSDIGRLPTEKLLRERELIAQWPHAITKWIERREAQVAYELGERKARGLR